MKRIRNVNALVFALQAPVDLQPVTDFNRLFEWFAPCLAMRMRGESWAIVHDRLANSKREVHW